MEPETKKKFLDFLDEEKRKRATLLKAAKASDMQTDGLITKMQNEVELFEELILYVINNA
jgi:hypothetical protein